MAFRGRTDVDVFQSRQIQSGANDICSSFREKNVPTVVALLHRLQNIRRIVGFEVIVAFDNALLVTFRRAMHLLVWTFRRVDQRGSGTLMCSNTRVVALHIFLVGSPGSESA